MHTWIMALELSKIKVYALLVKKFYPVFIKLGEYVCGHNISTKLYPAKSPRHSLIMALELSKIVSN